MDVLKPESKSDVVPAGCPVQEITQQRWSSRVWPSLAVLGLQAARELNEMQCEFELGSLGLTTYFHLPQEGENSIISRLAGAWRELTSEKHSFVSPYVWICCRSQAGRLALKLLLQSQLFWKNQTFLRYLDAAICPGGGWLSRSPAHLCEFSCAVNFSLRTKQWGAMVNLKVALHHRHLPRCELGEHLCSMQLICVDQGMGHLWRKPQHLWEQKASPGPDGWYCRELSCFLLRGKQRANMLTQLLQSEGTSELWKTNKI